MSTDPTYRTEVRAPGDCRVFGPCLIEFDPFRFVSVGAEERAALLVRLLNEAYEAGRLAELRAESRGGVE